MRCALALSLCLAACAHGPRSPDDERIVPDTAETISPLLTLPPELEPRRAAFAEDIARARALCSDFGTMHGWGDVAQKRSFTRAEVFASQAALWRRMLELNKLDPNTRMPTQGLAAGVEGGVLLAIGPEEYARVQPGYAALPESWPRLIAHELVHRLHVDILAGKEDAMGPPWFFEGLATFGAGQALDEGLRYQSADEALAAAHDGSSPESYRRYVAAVRYFAGRLSVADLVAHAGKPDFETWLKAAAPR